MAATVAAIAWRKRARIVRRADAVFYYFWSVDRRYVVVRTHSVLGGANGYRDRYTPYWSDPRPLGALGPLRDTRGGLVSYEVSARMERVKAHRVALERAKRACCLHAAGVPIPPARPARTVSRKAALRRLVKRIEGKE